MASCDELWCYGEQNLGCPCTEHPIGNQLDPVIHREPHQRALHPQGHPRSVTATFAWSNDIPWVARPIAIVIAIGHAPCPMPHPRRPPGSSSGGEGRQRWATALSFLHVAFVCLLELLRLRRNEQDELAVEGVILRHDLAVLCRQGDRLALWPTDRTVLAGLSRLVSRRRTGSVL